MKPVALLFLIISCPEDVVAQAQEVAEDSIVSVKDTIPQDRIDTLYYNRNWQPTANKAFASYYRYALYPADQSQPQEFKTYYMTGEPEGEGTFLSLSSTDDAKSVFVGEVMKYYRNGHLAERISYSDGILDGEHTSYYENGNVKVHETFLKGKLHGLHSQFNEEGKVCRLTPYSNGTRADYYVVTDYLGNYSKYSFNGDAPILETPQLDDMKTEYMNGVPWHYYNKNGLIVGVSNSIQKELGGYREIGLFVVNKSMTNIDVDPALIEVYSMKKGAVDHNFRLVDADTYDKKVLNQKRKLAKREKHKKKVLVVYEHEDNTNANLGANVFNSSDTSLQSFQKSIVSLKELTGESRMPYTERLPKDLGYLERTTVHPNEAVSGYVYTSDRKAEDLFVKVRVGGIDYLFEWKY